MEPNPTISYGSRCHRCGTTVRPLWHYCEPCRKAIAVEDRTEALEELSWRVQLEEERRRR